MNSQTKLVKLFGALGDPTRYRIVELLKRQPELCVSEVAAQVGITTAGVSQHMRVLETVGLVRPERMGQRICYRLVQENHEPLLSLLDSELGS